MPNTLSPNMSLILPTVGQEPGPNWALDLNSSLSIIDQHNHTPGSGAPITAAALDINVDLPFNNNNAISLKSVRFQSQLVPLSSGLDVGCLYVSGDNLYYNTSAGYQIQLTANNAVNVSPGSITNLIAPAALTYIPATQTFVFESNQGNATPASLDGGSLYLRNITPASNYTLIQPNSVLPASYSLTLPSALPASVSVLLLDTLGNISTSGTAAALSVTTLNSTTTNASTVNASSSVAIKNDSGLLQFRNTADSTQFAAITGSSSGLNLNLPDTADSYTFQVGGVTKATIDNNGISGTFPQLPYALSPSITSIVAQTSEPNDITVWTSSIVLTKANAVVLIALQPRSYTGGAMADYRFDGNGYNNPLSVSVIDAGHGFLEVSGPGGYSSTWFDVKLAISPEIYGTSQIVAVSGAAGTYNLTFKMGRARSNTGYGYAIQNLRMLVQQIA